MRCLNRSFIKIPIGCSCYLTVMSYVVVVSAMFRGNNGLHNNTRNEELLLSFWFQPVLTRAYSRYTLILFKNTKYEMYIAELWLKKFLAALEIAEEEIFGFVSRWLDSITSLSIRRPSQTMNKRKEKKYYETFLCKCRPVFLGHACGMP